MTFEIFKVVKISIVASWYIQHFGSKMTTINSNKSPTRCNNFSTYYPDVYLQLNMFRAFSRLSSRPQWLQWQPLVLPSYRGDSRVVFVVGPVNITATLCILDIKYYCHTLYPCQWISLLHPVFLSVNVTAISCILVGEYHCDILYSC
jgi:hypothetical protein